MSHKDNQLLNQLKTGVSNVEVDWFLRGKLPEFASSEAHPYAYHQQQHHPQSPSEDSTTTVSTPLAGTLSSPPTTATSLDTAVSQSSLNGGSKQRYLPSINEDDHINGRANFNTTLTRSKSVSCKELEQCRREEEAPKKKGGFLSKLFRSKSKESPSPSPSPVPQKSTQTIDIGKTSSPSPEPQFRGIYAGLSSSKSPYTNPNDLRRTRSLSVGRHDLDPKLAEFLRYYKAKGVSQLQNDLNPTINASTSTITSTASTATATQAASTQNQAKKQVKVDVLGRPIPAHPPQPKFPSAFAKHPKYAVTIDKPAAMSLPAESHSKLSFLKRVKSIQSDVQSVTSNTSVESHHTKPLTIPGLENLPPLKRVSFDVPVFFNDPPQQIPSRNPRKGEVEIQKDGSIVIHKLTLAEKRRLLSQSGGGIVVGGSGHLKIVDKQPDDSAPVEIGNGKIQTEEEYSENDEEEDQHKRQMKLDAAQAAASARGKETPNELSRTPTNTEEEVTVSKEATKISIDKPMVRHNKSSASLASLAEDEEQEEVYPPKDVKVPLDVLYTRCCHLREILPIPATLKQIKKDSYDPITLLQLRNPKPSLVEVLTFSDFISIAPILCISLDGVSMSSEMFRIILAALVSKPEFEKLTLRNTPLDEDGWKLLCWFLTKNRTLSRLDLTQVPSLCTNVQKPAKSSSGANVNRMECDMTNRSDMNWSLLNAALMTRNGIEELVLNGANMSETEFKDLFELGICLKTTKLGLAYNRLTINQCEVLGKCLDFEKLIGLDLGYNDLSGKLGIFNRYAQEKSPRDPQLRFISLNSTCLNSETNEVSGFLSNLVTFKELRYIDLSNNPKMFPSVIEAMTESFPLYLNLSRLHLDYNNLTTTIIIAISELIPFCKRLSYLSLMGNDIDNVGGAALTSSMKISTSVITLDVNYDQLSLKFREDIAMYTVRNMKHQIEANERYGNGKSSGNEDFISLQEQLTALLQSADVEKGEMPDSRLIDGFLKKITVVRAKIHESIDELFKLRVQGGLNLEGKEALIRFCFIDSSIEKGLQLLNKKLNLTPEQSAYLHTNANHEQEESSIQNKLRPPVLTRQSSMPISNYVDQQGHAELFPFGVSSNHHNDNGSDDSTHEESELKDDELARAADDSHIKEEASMLKIGSYFKNNRENLSQNISSEHIETLMAISGDKLKDALLKTNNVQDLVGILDEFKEKGIQLGEIYKKDSNSEYGARMGSGGLDLETLKNTTKNSFGNHVRSCVVDGKQEEDSDSESESNSSDTEGADQGDVDMAYDEVLDHLERVRTNS